MSLWTDERLDELKTMWAGAMSAAEIAAKLGNGITRNAVLGKVHRLKLEKRVNTWQGREAARPSALPRPKTVQTVLRTSPAPAKQPVPVVPVPDLVEPTGDGVSIHRLDNLFEMCRWIVKPDPQRRGGDRYCGEPTVKGCSWCGWHKAKVFTKATGPNPQPERKVVHKPSMADRSFGAVQW